MPYWGLVQTNGRELRAPGYHRIDMMSIQWAMTVPHDGDPLEVDFGFINIMPFLFGPAEADWPPVQLAFFREIDDPAPRAVRQREPYHVLKGDKLYCVPGAVRLTQSNTKWHDDGDDDVVTPPPPIPSAYERTK